MSVSTAKPRQAPSTATFLSQSVLTLSLALIASAEIQLPFWLWKISILCKAQTIAEVTVYFEQLFDRKKEQDGRLRSLACNTSLNESCESCVKINFSRASSHGLMGHLSHSSMCLQVLV